MAGGVHGRLVIVPWDAMRGTKRGRANARWDTATLQAHGLRRIAAPGLHPKSWLYGPGGALPEPTAQAFARGDCLGESPSFVNMCP